MERLRFYTTERLGQTRFETPEGYLLIKDVPIARTGTQVYGPGEVPVEAGPDGRILIEREPDEVFRPETLASFNLKPLTDDHPSVNVDPSNWRVLTVGVLHDPRRGEGSQDDLMIADLMITCPKMIASVKSGERREVSAGYDADYEQTEPGRGFQRNIIGNHLAFVERGRCGERCSMGDQSTTTKSKEDQDCVEQTQADGQIQDCMLRSRRSIRDRRIRHVHLHLHDETAHDPRSGQFTSGGSGGRAATLAKAINAPAHAQVHEIGGPTGHGTISYNKSIPHAEAHKDLVRGGFRRETNKRGVQHQKMGRSAAYSSSKVQHSSYVHPEGHTAQLKTTTPKYGEHGPSSSHEIVLK